jgi:hypothetical protein
MPAAAETAAMPATAMPTTSTAVAATSTTVATTSTAVAGRLGQACASGKDQRRRNQRGPPQPRIPLVRHGMPLQVEV